MYPIESVEKWFLYHSPMANSKLCALLYYAYAWYIVLMNETHRNIRNRLFEDRPEAWGNGPMFRKLFIKYYERKAVFIPRRMDCPTFDEYTTEILEYVWLNYGGYSAEEIQSICTQEQPFKSVRERPVDYTQRSLEFDDRELHIYYGARLDF